MSTPNAKNIFSSFQTENQEKKYAPLGYENVTPPKLKTCGSHSPEEGIDFILCHLVSQPLFPRNIMTKSLGYQIEVFDKDSIRREFELSNWMDCRISAYPKLTEYNGIKLVAPSLVMIDLDISSFASPTQLVKTVKTTLHRIQQVLRARPTVLWTGNGYHIYLPINAFVLEEEQIFCKYVRNGDPDLSTKFIRFAERSLADGKHDPRHRPSVNNCLLRVPGTYNSKNGEEVTIVQKWDSHRPNIRYLLRDFRVYLIQETLDQINAQSKRSKMVGSNSSIGIEKTATEACHIGWIERLLQTPIVDHRKYCLWRILAPYLVNVRRLDDDASQIKLMEWLSRCDSIKRLSFNPRFRVNDVITRAKRVGYYHISWYNLQSENATLYDQLVGSQDSGPHQ